MNFRKCWISAIKYLCQCWYKHKIFNSKSCGNDFFAIGCGEVFVGALHPFDNPMKTKPFKNPGHG